MKFSILIGLFCLGVSGICAVSSDPVPADDFEKMVLRPVSESRWRAKSISVKGSVVSAAPDFFVEEFGKPCVFTEDWIQKEGFADAPYTVKDGALRFSTGTKGFLFGIGPRMGSFERPALNIGITYGHIQHAQVVFIMEAEQSADVTEWVITPHTFRGARASRRFKLTGRGKRKTTVSLGTARAYFRDAPIGFSVKCVTPGVKIAVSSLSIVPRVTKAAFRGSFDLKEKPLFAHASYKAAAVYELYINGNKVVEGTRNHGAGEHAHIDLTKYLKAGRNQIACSLENDTYGSFGVQSFHLEGMAFDRKGEITRFVTDETWKGSAEPGKGWMNADYNDSAWKKTRAVSGIFCVGTGNGQTAFNGLNPRHMGLLQPKPANAKYPLFDHDKPIVYSLRLPAGLPAQTLPEVEIRTYPERKMLGTVKPVSKTQSGDWTDCRFAIPAQKPGPYKLCWKLASGGKILERNNTDMIVAGPVEQGVCALADLKKKLDDDMELVYSIDCTKPEKSSADFIDHTGLYVGIHKLDTGRVTKKDGMVYRESGLQTWDHFGYRINLFRYRGQPLVVEVDIPDNEIRDVPVIIYESYPLAFTNNGRRGENGHGVASGTLRTGLDIPLSGKMRKLRFLYWPGSALASIHVGTWYQGSRAAASAIRFYRLKSGALPYAKGAMNRFIGPHCERITNIADTAMRTFDMMMSDRKIFVNGADDAYCILYRMYQEKIRFLRFIGQNYTTEGVYMYSGGNYPSLKHSALYCGNYDVDPLLLALKMYHFNDIRCDLGFEYMSSPFENSSVKHYSDRKIQRGEGKAAYMLDRHGRQTIGQSGGINFMNPDEQACIIDCIREIAERYGKEKSVDGFLMTVGSWWAPAWMVGTFKDITDKEVGYDDDTVAQFEKDHKINLGIPPLDPKRFDKRCRLLLSPKYRDSWIAWRNLQLKKCLEKIGSAIAPNPLYVTLIGLEEKDSPFVRSGASFKERDDFYGKRYTEAGYPLALYPPEGNIKLMAVASYLTGNVSPSGKWLAEIGKNYSKSMLEVVRRYGQIFWHPSRGLEELTYPVNLNKKWFFKGTNSSNSFSRPAGEFAMTDYANYLETTTPKKFVTTWTDCNLDTNIDTGIAEFSLGYRAVPDLRFVPCPDVKGGSPMTASDGKYTYLRLVNNSFHIAKGSLKTTGSEFTNLVTGEQHRGSTLAFIMKPNTVAVFRTPGAKNVFTGELRLPAIVEKETVKAIDAVATLATVPSDLKTALKTAQEKQDIFRAHQLLNSFEVARSTEAIRKSIAGQKYQDLLLEDLKKSRARINCAYDKIYIAPNGDRWLPDQLYFGPLAYGNENAFHVDRGTELKIDGSDLQRVYSTEAFGVVVRYYIPVPNGKYVVYLHFAETFSEIKTPGRRSMTVEVQGKRHPKKIDPFADAGGFAKPYVLKLDNVEVKDGIVAIRLINTVGIQGIEIERK